MASKNSIKTFTDNTFYHVYNRGVEKRNIFQDDQDYSVFLSYLKTYLLPKDKLALHGVLRSQESTPAEKDRVIKLLKLKNYSDNIDLVCYALLPNHFHFLIRQNFSSLNHFMNSLGTRYSMYFNRKYKRIGVLFQDVYKAVPVQTDEQLLHLSRYIHLNPIRYLGVPVENWGNILMPSSLPEYFGMRKSEWVKSSYILNYFSKTNKNNTYETFLNLPADESIVVEAALDYDQE